MAVPGMARASKQGRTPSRPISWKSVAVVTGELGAGASTELEHKVPRATVQLE